jgi:hypothetical protein
MQVCDGPGKMRNSKSSVSAWQVALLRNENIAQNDAEIM